MNPGDMNQLHATRGDYPTPRKAIVTLAIIASSIAGMVALQPYVARLANSLGAGW